MIANMVNEEEDDDLITDTRFDQVQISGAQRHQSFFGAADISPIENTRN